MFALLVLASFGAFFLAQRLKHIPTAVQSFYIDPQFHPEGGPAPHREAISFQIERDDRVTVQVVSASGTDVATLARARSFPAHTTINLHWNGRYGKHRDGARRPAGPPAPAGEYRVRVFLLHRHFEVFSPTSFALVRRRAG